jgi:hypothetical protein
MIDGTKDFVSRAREVMQIVSHKGGVAVVDVNDGMSVTHVDRRLVPDLIAAVAVSDDYLESVGPALVIFVDGEDTWYLDYRIGAGFALERGPAAEDLRWRLH